jgi:Arc/MetJ-type ribon-helix-helix transcriptional regulator
MPTWTHNNNNTTTKRRLLKLLADIELEGNTKGYQVTTIAIPTTDLATIEELVATGKYGSRSDVIRRALDAFLKEELRYVKAQEYLNDHGLVEGKDFIVIREAG